LAKLHRCIEERRLIALPTADNVEDIRLFGFSNDQLNVLKTYPTLDPDQPPTPVTDEERSDILLQNLNSAQNRINRMENISTDDYYHILVVGETDSGKAAVINGLIRRDIIPSGGRHPTLAPVEILDAQDINGREEIHLCRKDMDYDYRNSDTFARGDIRNLSNIISNWQGKEYHVRYDTIRVYVDHRRARGSFFSNNRRKVHIIDSVDLNTAIDATRFLLENREINALMLIIDAREGLTESNENIMRSCCEEKKQIFVVITHLDCVCDCEDECDGSCSNIRKQKITYAIREISPETFASADRLIHGVNPTLVPLQNNNPGYATRQIPSEWARMEECLREFICEQSHFRSLSSIEDYLKKLMFDVLLFAQLNEAVAASKMEEKKRRILQLEDNIGRLEDEYVETCKVARIKVDETKSEVFVYILNVMNELKDNPEKFVSRELMNRIDPKSSEADLQRLLQERWREIEDEINQKVIEYIQNCANDINQLVKDLPKDSTQRDFATIRLMLQATYLNASDTEMPKKSLKSIVQDMTSRVLTGFEKNSVQTWTQIMYQTFIEINQNMRKDPELTAADDNEQENR
jgi:GTP-binding protein EngB required for normal cell division